MNTQLSLPIHTAERTQGGTAWINEPDNRKRLEGNCIKLLRYWQKNRLPLNKHTALEWLGVDCLAQRCKDIRDNGIALDIVYIGKNRLAHYKLACTCKLIGGEYVGECWSHSEKLRVK